MSERGSFVTEYIYCDKCFAALKKLLVSNDKYLCSRTISSWHSKPFMFLFNKKEELPIIAGKVGGLYSGEELNTFEFELNPKIAKVICHPVRIAVLAESGEQIFHILPEQ